MDQKKKIAFITGINGQDGSYLAELLLNKGYEVHGLVRRASTFNRGRIEHLITPDRLSEGRSFFLHYGDLTDSGSMRYLVRSLQPHEVYHLGAQSHVQISFETPEFTADSTALSTTRLLDAVYRESPHSKFYQASSSEMFGAAKEVPQKETTPFHPRSPYAVSKVYAYWATINYRESYGMHASNGILFNHESERRGENFVSRKITTGLAKISSGKIDKLYLGNLYAKRDWGYAKDYVEGMWRMLQQPEPGDYVLATGESHTVKEFIEEACRLLGIELRWEGEGLNEKGIDKKTGKTLIEVDSHYFRPAEVDHLIGDYSKAKQKLDWGPKTTFKDLVKVMLAHDLKREGINRSL